MGLRRDVSLLLSEGHPDANRYPIVKVWNEALIVRQRRAQRLKLETVLMQSVIASVVDKKGGKALRDQLKRLTESG